MHRGPDYESSLSAEAAHLRVSSSRTPSPHSRSSSRVGQPSPPLPPLPSFYSDHVSKDQQTPSLYDSDSDPSIPSQSLQQQNLAPPPAAPHGPRSPAPVLVQRSTPPSPTPSPLGLAQVNDPHVGNPEGGDSSPLLEEDGLPVQPSAKALGKRKVVDLEVGSGREFFPVLV